MDKTDCDTADNMQEILHEISNDMKNVSTVSRGRQIAFMIDDYFRVTGAHDTVLDYADLSSITLRNDNVQDFDTRWDEILLSMTKIPSDDVLESLYRMIIRESDQLKKPY